MANEKRMIDANAIDYENIWCTQHELWRLHNFIEAQPTVDAVEVVHGRWDKYEDDKFMGYDANGRIQYRKVYTYYCGRCGRGTAVKTNYCPNCGAKMDGDGND